MPEKQRGRETEREGWREGGRQRGKETEREGDRKGGRQRGRETEREGDREGGREKRRPNLPSVDALLARLEISGRGILV